MRYVVRTFCLSPDADQDLIAMLDAAPNRSALVREALRAYKDRAETNDLLRQIRDMIRAAGAQSGASEEPAEAIAALDDLLDRFK